jgi:hypothetical protein
MVGSCLISVEEMEIIEIMELQRSLFISILRLLRSSYSHGLLIFLFSLKPLSSAFWDFFILLRGNQV